MAKDEAKRLNTETNAVNRKSLLSDISDCISVDTLRQMSECERMLAGVCVQKCVCVDK